MVAWQRTTHGGEVTVPTRRWPKAGLHLRGRCGSSRLHGNGHYREPKAAGEVGGGELVRVDMADVHGAVARFGVVVVVTVKPALALESRPYDDDQMREREVRGGRVVAGHSELELGGAPWPWW